MKLCSSTTALRLRRPSAHVLGTASDVEKHLPLLHSLSKGAKRGVPGWVPQPPLNSTEIVDRKRSASWLEVTYPFASDEELRDHYQLADGSSLRAGMFLEELDAFSADCAFRRRRTVRVTSGEPSPSRCSILAWTSISMST